VAWDRSWAEVYPGVRTRKTNHRLLRCLSFTAGGGLGVKLRGARCSMVLTSGLRCVRWCFLEVACRTCTLRTSQSYCNVLRRHTVPHRNPYNCPIASCISTVFSVIRGLGSLMRVKISKTKCEPSVRSRQGMTRRLSIRPHDIRSSCAFFSFRYSFSSVVLVVSKGIDVASKMVL